MEKNVICGEKLERTIINLNLGQLLLPLLRSYSENVLLIDAETDEKLLGGTLLKKAIRISKYLKRNFNLGVGDSVSIMCENRLEFSTIPVAAYFIGATFAPMNPEYSPEELKHCLNISKPKVIFASPSTITRIVKIRHELPFLKKLVLFDSDDNNSSFIGFNRLIKGVESDEIPENFEVPPYDPVETVATILCSSGTTGMPKGVMCTHENMTAFIDIVKEWKEGEDVQRNTFLVIPQYHSYGFMTMFLHVLAGSPSVLMRKFRPKLFLDSLVKYQIARLILPPPIIVLLAKYPKVSEYDLSFIQEIVSGAAPLSKQTEQEILKKLKVKFIGQGYGMTETTLSVTRNMSSNKPGSVGPLVRGMMAKVIDENGNALGPNQEGELCLKGPLIMKGYMNDEEATKNCIDTDGWLHTGDVAYYDQDKYFYIVDRLKELIKYKAFQVPPAELEKILIQHPNVLDAAVIGIPDEYAGELPLAYVVKKPGVNVTEKELQEFVAGKVSPQKQLRGGVRFISEIPRTSTGKILRRLLRELAKKTLNSKL